MPPRKRSRSWSQLEQYARCPYEFYLARVERKWQRPAAWSPMGTAVHSAAEAYELSERRMSLEEARQTFRDSYVSEIDELLSHTPNTSFWESSGPYRGEDDIPRRFGIGLEHVDRYVRWYEAHPDQVPWRLPSGKLAIEIPFTLDLGGIRVKGVIDYLGRLGDHEALGPRDNKTGAKPGKLMQLKIYGVAAEDYFTHIGHPREIRNADFFMTKFGKPTVNQDLSQVTRDEVVVLFQELDAKVEAGDFPPKPGEACRRCSVRDSCIYREG